MNKQELQDTLRNAKYANPIDIKNRISDNKFYSELIELILTKADNSQLQLLESLVHGKANAKVFETKAALDAWLLVAENKSSLIIGDIFYLREVGIPDFWWDGDTLQELESTKPDLSNLATLTQLGLKADKTQVLTNVPANAKFTDTIYTEISESEINTGTSDVPRSISGRRIGYIKQIINNDLGLKLDKSSVKQVLGASTTDVMSQNAVTQLLGDRLEELSNNWIKNW